MTVDPIVYVCLTFGLVSALVAGVFQSFSDFVMRSLVAAHPTSGIEAMQLINRKVYHSMFLVMLLGLAPLAAGFAALAYFWLGGPERYWIGAGAVIYLTTVFGVTVFGNVPMNNRLDRLGQSSAGAEAYWRMYGVSWTRLNHVRTLGSVATAICFLLAAAAST